VPALHEVPLAVPAAIGVAAASALAWLLVRTVRFRRDPVERERRRRIHVHVNGRMGEALIFQADETELRYSYEIGGVSYNTSQEIGTLLPVLPDAPERLLGTALMKYDPNNPANSIVVCEHWAGFRKKKQ